MIPFDSYQPFGVDSLWHRDTRTATREKDVNKRQFQGGICSLDEILGLEGKQVKINVCCILPPSSTEPPTPKFDHHKFDPAYPGICFLGDPWQETVTSEGKVISWDDDIGIRFTIPPGAVAEGEKLHLTVRPCLNGPFVLPQDRDLASPMYLIQPACNFKEEVELSMSHFVNIKSDEDIESLTFISAHSKPVRGRSGPEYRLREFQNGVFHVGQSSGTISLKHFCILGVGTKRVHSEDDDAPEAERNMVKKVKGLYVC